MITHSQIGDFAKRKVEKIEESSGRQLTDQERVQVAEFFNAFGREFKKFSDRGMVWPKQAEDLFFKLNAPEIVKLAFEEAAKVNN